MQDEKQRYLTMLHNLLAGKITPRSVVGTGYVNAKQVASECIRKQIHNIENPSQKVVDVYVSSSGAAYKSELLAMKSKVYQSILNNTFKAINNFVITDYGVMPAPGGDGYMMYVA